MNTIDRWPHKKKVLIVRETTERQETIQVGLGRLVGRHISAGVDWALSPPPPQAPSPYGSGQAAAAIAELLITPLSQAPV